MYHPCFKVYISSMKGIVNIDIAEEILQKCVDILDSELHTDDVCSIEDAKNENNIYFGCF